MCFALDELDHEHASQQTDGVDVHTDPAPEQPYREDQPDRQLLHERFAHAHVERLTSVRSKYHLPTNLRPSCPCRTCMMTRQAEKPRSSTQLHDAPRAASKLDRVNVDLHGPYPEQSFGQYRYVTVFVDSCTGHLHVTPIRSKTDTLDALQEYIQRVGKPRTLTHDRGTKFAKFAGTFQDYCRAHAINVLRTEGYAPWRNGRVERANGTLKHHAKAMLVHAGLPLKFWARAILTAAYVLNRLPTRGASDNELLLVTPHELMFGTPPNIDHLHVFGSICYPVTPHALQHGGTVVTAEPHIFVSYDDRSSEGYMCFNPATSSFITRRTVSFDEHW